ncbi:MAG: hypothetical protein KJ922_00970, partial [Nanoarchaeota archaeon]|nr:hypothetical protein [Nanoarchaeota archaeon]
KVCDGTVLKNLSDLRRALRKMPEDKFRYHFSRERNDFFAWVRDMYQDKELASQIHNAKSSSEIVAAISRRLNKARKKRDLTEIDQLSQSSKQEILQQLGELR